MSLAEALKCLKMLQALCVCNHLGNSLSKLQFLIIFGTNIKNGWYTKKWKLHYIQTVQILTVILHVKWKYTCTVSSYFELERQYIINKQAPMIFQHSAIITKIPTYHDTAKYDDWQLGKLATIRGTKSSLFQVAKSTKFYEKIPVSKTRLLVHPLK